MTNKESQVNDHIDLSWRKTSVNLFKSRCRNTKRFESDCHLFIGNGMLLVEFGTNRTQTKLANLKGNKTTKIKRNGT